MKKLQKNYTTPKQSKKLIALGVPTNSADCYYMRESPKRLYILNDGETISKLRLRLNMAHTMPCWSLGQLLAIMAICGDNIKLRKLDITRVSQFYNDSVNVIELAIEDIEKLIADDGIDFSKLEK